jgi:hypothetical protein
MFNIINKKYLLNLALLAIFILQICFWYNTKHIKPEMIIVPKAPTEKTINLLSLGDKQFFFRYLGFKIQNAGDSWGRFTALKNYDYQELIKWFYLLNDLDKTSNYPPTMAAYYYGQTQNANDTIYIIDYLYNHAKTDLRNKWWWLVQAVYLANHRLKDKQLALKIAYTLNSVPKDVDMPLWARQMPAFIHEQLGENQAAKKIILEILKGFDNLSAKEKNFMHHFIVERLKDEKFRKELLEEMHKGEKK